MAEYVNNFLNLFLSTLYNNIAKSYNMKNQHKSRITYITSDTNMIFALYFIFSSKFIIFMILFLLISNPKNY